MKRKINYLFSIIAFLICHVLVLTTVAQVNLVPNPSFEDTVFCPWVNSQLEACSLWQNFGNTPDYFNSCDWAMNVPNTPFGFQHANSGVGMAGIIIYNNPNAPSGPNYRETIGIALNHSLQINEKYYFSFFTNFSNTPNLSIASNNIGLKFSTVDFDSCCPPHIDNFAHCFSSVIITDSINWSQISGSFIADSAYSYVMIGNFFDDTSTDTLQIGQYPSDAYYFIDDVCVTTDSVYNQTWTHLPIILQQNDDIKLQLTSNSLKLVSINKPIDFVSMYNTLGQQVFNERNINSNEFIILTDRLISSTYIITVYTSNSSITKKLMIMH